MSSERHVTVVRIERIEPHPNADRLSITRIHGGYPVVIRSDEFREGDLAVYVPVDAIVPPEARWAFLKDQRRIRARRIRGTFSMGLLAVAEPGWTEGQRVGELLGITHHEPIVERPDEDERDPGSIPHYTDVEPLRRWEEILRPDEEVVVTEKIHGTNGRFGWVDGRLWCGSRTRFKVPGVSQWWRIADAYGLAAKLAADPGLVLYGEVYGRVQELRYGVDDAVRLIVFDALDLALGRYLDYDRFVERVDRLGLPQVPVLYRGPWRDLPPGLAEGPSVLGGGHVREGFVVRPTVERFDDRVGRVILKLHGEGYLTR